MYNWQWDSTQQEFIYLPLPPTKCKCVCRVLLLCFDLKRVNCHLGVPSSGHTKCWICYMKPKVSAGHVSVGVRELDTSVGRSVMWRYLLLATCSLSGLPHLWQAPGCAKGSKRTDLSLCLLSHLFTPALDTLRFSPLPQSSSSRSLYIHCYS